MMLSDVPVFGIYCLFLEKVPRSYAYVFLILLLAKFYKW